MDKLCYSVVLKEWTQVAKALRELKKKKHKKDGFYPVVTEVMNGFHIQIYKNKMKEILICPNCGSDQIAATAEQMFMINTGEHYCHSVKIHDGDAKATCLSCRWEGLVQDLGPKS